MTDLERFERLDVVPGVEILGPTVREILRHLCGGGAGPACRGHGMVVEWCESRGDCCHEVVCPGCALRFLVDEEELAELRRWTDAEGNALVCGVRWD